jgi:outer membrane protein assembly factor BamB
MAAGLTRGPLGKAEAVEKIHQAFAGAAAAVLTLVCSQSAHADSFFWAINQFSTIERLNGDTGAVVDSFAVPLGAGNAASIAFVGNTGYYTLLGNSDIYTVDMNTHLSGGIAFNIGATAGLTNGITTDASGNLWFADGNNGALKQFNTSGTLLGTFTCLSGRLCGVQRQDRRQSRRSERAV